MRRALFDVCHAFILLYSCERRVAAVSAVVFFVTKLGPLELRQPPPRWNRPSIPGSSCGVFVELRCHGITPVCSQCFRVDQHTKLTV